MDAKVEFQNPDDALARSAPSPILKFERPDWALFRTVEGLSQKAGVPPHKLIRLVVKEICDNALDEAGKASVGKLPDGGGYFVEDGGRGMDPAEVSGLYSIKRSLVSTKLLRLPTRGALGNGLRVVAGAVQASSGTLTVITRNRRVELKPEYDGTTSVISATDVAFPTGTRVEISFGPALPDDHWTLQWAQLACRLAQGKVYAGRSSPWWYDPSSFHELFAAAGNRPVREVIAELDGCTGATAGVIVAAAKLNRTVCNTITREQATRLLEAARLHARPVTAERLGAIGPNAFLDCAYAMASGSAEFGSVAPLAEVPFVVEAWAQKAAGEAAEFGTDLTMCVNRTPITGVVDIARDKRDIDAFGCGLSHTIAHAPTGAEFFLVINITTPHMPITSDGKEPNLEPFLAAIMTATEKAVRKAHRPTAGSRRISQKDIVLDNLDAVIAEVSENGQFEFNPRHLLYPLRKIVMDEIGETLKTPNFNSIITDYENEHGEIEGCFREPRGSIYHPHTGETITLGSRMVADYKRPPWLYNKSIYIEKEGFTGGLKAGHWPERQDGMLMSSKGFSTRAARDLVDKLAEHNELIFVFLVHDADAHGTVIYETFQEATKARGARLIKVINLGLEPWEAIAMGLQVEEVERLEKRRPVANYVRERTDRAPDGTKWEEWLQTHRIELNAMKPAEFIAWLNRKLAGYEKLIPPDDIIEAELDARIAAKIRKSLTERILREANAEAQIAAAIADIEKPGATALTTGIKKLFKKKPASAWRDHIETVATELTGAAASEDAQ